MRILYLDLDALTPSHLGCYGYSRNTSPAIDTIAREGTRLDNVYTPDAPCLPSRTALYSGRFGIQTGVVGHGGTAAQPRVQGRLRGFRDDFTEHGLVKRLTDVGLHTAMISPFGQRHAAHHFYAGFREIHNTGGNGLESAEQVTPLVHRWLDTNAASDNWFLHVNYWDIHTPYRMPPDFPNHFVSDPLPAWLTPELLQQHLRRAGPHSALEMSMYDDVIAPKYPRYPGKLTDMATLRQMIDGYDNAIRYVDLQVAGIVAKLKSIGIYDETAIIISADHGENMGELGIYGEHATADHATCNIPLIIKWPGKNAGGVDADLHYNLDLAPTLMELLNGKPSDLWDGRSLAPSLDGRSTGRDELVVSQCAHVCQRSVRWGDWLYIRTYHDGFQPFEKEMLFNLPLDPHELNDVASRHPDVLREGAWRMSRWHDEQMNRLARHARANGTHVEDPLWRVIADGGPFHALDEPGRSPLPKYLERLDATGRSDGAQTLREKYPWLAK
ncbi:MAG: sulfatase-like hydrolase/transferase [Tepidisphaeraceae bacterium]